MKRLIIAALCAAGLACTSQIGHVNLVILENVNGLPPPIRRGAVGEDCQIEWTRDLQPKLDRAIAQAIGTTGDGNALANVTVTSSRWLYVLFQQNCIGVQGDVVKVGGVAP